MDVWSIPLDDLLNKWTMERLAYMLGKRVERLRLAEPKRNAQGRIIPDQSAPPNRPEYQHKRRQKPDPLAARNLAAKFARNGVKIQRVQARGTMASLTAIADTADPDFITSGDRKRGA